ncbi:thioredoxin family protein, partial [Arthrospira platensis SPKY1]|nr:thioredoxin family protein [Arthrospira platensis SPKY1]
CGDAAANIPMIMRLAEVNPHIELRLLLRDEHPEIMDRYLTRGARSIPKMVMYRAADMRELGTWGPRPAYLQEWLYRNKESQELSQGELAEAFQKWYAKDKGQTLAEEILALAEG